jgi:hypothetical protein
MRDIIWTLIVVWLIYKIVNIFRINSTKNAYSQNKQANPSSNNHKATEDKDIKEAIRKHVNKEGEYVDFEEIKNY